MEAKTTVWQCDFSRRSFLTGAGVAVAGTPAAVALPRVAHADEPAEAPVVPAAERIFDGVELAVGHVVHDPDICSGCRTCEIVCSTYHEGRASSSRSRLQWRKAVMDACITDIYACKQCPGAECVAVCPAEALTVDPNTGARVIDESKCVGCQLCMEACPVNPPMIRYDATTNTCFKCDLCGGDPQCVKFCPTGALAASWVEVEADGAEDEFYELDITGDARLFAHVETPMLSLTDGSGGIQLDGVIWTSHATQFNIILATFDITADAYDASGNLVGSSDGSAHAEIPEMSSAEFVLNIPTSAKVADLGRVVLHIQSAYVTNAPGQEDAAAGGLSM